MVSGSIGLGVFLEVGRPAGKHEEAREKENSTKISVFRISSKLSKPIEDFRLSLRAVGYKSNTIKYMFM